MADTAYPNVALVDCLKCKLSPTLYGESDFFRVICGCPDSQNPKSRTPYSAADVWNHDNSKPATKPDLKPCPFCGSAEVDGGLHWEAVRCDNCEAQGPRPIKEGKTGGTCWNQRTSPEAASDAALERLAATLELAKCKRGETETAEEQALAKTVAGGFAALRFSAKELGMSLIKASEAFGRAEKK